MDYRADRGRSDNVVTLGSRSRADGVVNSPKGRSTRENADDAVDLVYQAAETWKEIQDHAAATVARAESLARDAIKQLQLAQTRIEDAEAARDRALADLADMSATVAEVKREFGQLRLQLSDKEAKLCAAEERAATAEMRAGEASEALERLVDAVRNELPRKKGNVAAKASVDRPKFLRPA